MGRGKRSEFNLIDVHAYTFILIRDARLLCVVSGILFDLSGDLGRGLCVGGSYAETSNGTRDYNIILMCTTKVVVLMVSQM